MKDIKNIEHLKEMANEIVPEETRMILMALNSDIDWAIISVLNIGEMTFSDLKKELNLDNNKILHYHLKKLIGRGIINNYYKHSFFNSKYSYYSISNLGKRIVNILNNLFIETNVPITLKSSFSNSESIKENSSINVSKSEISNIIQR
ncbi:MAG: winged helix-turn-helix domain-containing protein [Thermoplasmata archaeon]